MENQNWAPSAKRTTYLNSKKTKKFRIREDYLFWMRKRAHGMDIANCIQVGARHDLGPFSSSDRCFGVTWTRQSADGCWPKLD